MKWLLPWHRFTIDSPYPPDTAAAMLASQVGPGGVLFFARGDKPFCGEVSGSTFKVMRVIRYRNSFLPVVSGTLEPRGAGTRVHVRLRLHAWVMAFIVFFLAIVWGHARPSEGCLFELGMSAFLVAMTLGGFWFEATKQEPMLRAIFAPDGER